MPQTLFTFQSPVSQSETQSMIESAVLSIGGTVKSQTGYMKCKWKRKGFLMGVRFEFYISYDDNSSVRVITPMNDASGTMSILTLTKDPIDMIWGRFVESLLAQNPNMDFNISSGDPIVDAVMYSDNEIQQVFVSSTKHHPSYGKAILGGALFGDVGAVIGGMGGSSKTNTRSFSQVAKKVYMKVRMSNGRIKEGNIDIRSKQYNMIMVNMKQLQM